MPSLPYVLALRAAESVINQALRYDPATRQRLRELDGKAIFIETLSPAMTMMVRIDQQRIRLLPESDQRPHATIEAPSYALLKLAISEQPQLIGSALRVHGQVQLIEQLHGIARQLDIDWEEPLSLLLGDSAGHQLGQSVRGLLSFARKTARTFVMNSTEYLQEEQELLPVRWEIEEFMDETQDLRADTERLEARLQRLQQRIQRLQANTSEPSA